jgi:hypothetical protein
MTYVKLFSVAAILLVAAEAQPRDCPTWLSQSGIANDVGLLSDAVSWEGADAETIDGVCGTYSLLHEVCVGPRVELTEQRLPSETDERAMPPR